MSYPLTLVYYLVINTMSYSPPVEQFFSSTNEPQKEYIDVDKSPQSKFKQLTCSDNDFGSDDDED